VTLVTVKLRLETGTSCAIANEPGKVLFPEWVTVIATNWGSPFEVCQATTFGNPATQGSDPEGLVTWRLRTGTAARAAQRRAERIF